MTRKHVAGLDMSLRCRIAIHLYPLWRTARRDRSGPLIGTIGDSYDNALETVNGYYKAELIYGPVRTRPWKTVEDVELATLSWVYWHNTSRLHSYLNDIPPTEFEAAFYDAHGTDQPLAGIQ